MKTPTSPQLAATHSRMGRLVRTAWPLIGAGWGAWLGFGGYFHIHFTGDSLAGLLVPGFFAMFAVIGAVLGALVGGAVGWVTAFLLRRLGWRLWSALLGASLVSFGALWLLSGAVQARYPGIRPPPTVDPVRRLKVLPPARNPCLDAPPGDLPARRSWEAECR